MKLFFLFIFSFFLCFNLFASKSKSFKEEREKSVSLKKAEMQRYFDKKSKFFKEENKKVPRAKKYSREKKKYSNKKRRPKKRKFSFKKLIKHIYGEIQVEEVNHGNANILKLRLSDRKNKYRVQEVYYRVGKLFSKSKMVETYEENNEMYANIDISDVPVGEYKIYFRFMASHNDKSKGRGRERGKKYGLKKLRPFLSTATFEKKQQIFALFSFDAPSDASYVEINASESYSEGGELSQYIYKLYKAGEQVDEVSSSDSLIIYSFKDIGTFEIEVTVIDQSENMAVSDRQEVVVTNSVPVLKYNLTEVEGLSGHFTVDFSESYSNVEGTNLFYEIFVLRDNNGVIDQPISIYSASPVINFTVPYDLSDYTIQFIAVDSNNNFSLESAPFSYEGLIAPKNEWIYVDPNPDNPTEKWIGAQFKDDGSIVSYHYKATHEDGTVILPFHNEQHSWVNLPKKGVWTFEFYAIDDEGIKSDTITRVIDVQWDDDELIPFYEWHYFERSHWDPRVWIIGTGFNDPLGEVVGYEFKATHSDGTTIYGAYDDKSLRDNELWFVKKGTWSIEISTIDNDGNSSLPYSFEANIDWDEKLPITDLSLGSDGAYNYWVLENLSYPEDVSRNYISATHESGERITGDFEYWGFYITLNRRGDWSLKYQIKDMLGFYSEPVFKEVYIEEIVVNSKISTHPEEPRTYTMDFSGSYDPLDPLRDVNFRIKATHESGEIVSFFNESNRVLLKLPLVGQWEVEVFGTDTPYGVESGYFSEIVNVENLKPVAMLEITQSEEWNHVTLNASGSSDPDGQVDKYLYTFRYENGEVVEYETRNSFESLTLKAIPGTVEISLEVFDEDGLVSENFSQSVELLGPPVADFELIAITAPLKFKVDMGASHSPDGSTLSYQVEVKKEKNTIHSFETNSSMYELPSFRENGIYEVYVTVKNSLGLVSLPEVKSITVELPNVGDDILPPHPGEAGKLTVEGVDLDQDGVRDDIEHYINDLLESPDLPVRRDLLNFSKAFSKLVLNSSDSGTVKESYEEFISAGRCMSTKYGKEDGGLIYDGIKLAHINTEDRFIHFLKARDHVAGVVFNLPEEESCEE